jgi:hypothetical protein
VIPTVMAGLVPVIHVLERSSLKKDVDARHKAGHDDERLVLVLNSPDTSRSSRA